MKEKNREREWCGVEEGEKKEKNQRKRREKVEKQGGWVTYD